MLKLRPECEDNGRTDHREQHSRRGNYKSKRQRPGGRATLDVWADQEPLMTQRPRMRKAENGGETRETGGGLMTNAPIGRMDLF